MKVKSGKYYYVDYVTCSTGNISVYDDSLSIDYMEREGLIKITKKQANIFLEQYDYEKSEFDNYTYYSTTGDYFLSKSIDYFLQQEYYRLLRKVGS